MDKIIQILKLIRPKYYYRITWLLVSSGVVLLTPSIYMTILDYFFQKKLNLKILGEYDILLGIFLIIIGLAYNLIIHLNEHKSDAKINSDKEIFSKLDVVLSESAFNDFLDKLIGNESISPETNTRVNDFMRKANTTEFRFNKQKIETRKKEFVKDLDKLMDFVDTEFFSHPNPSVDLNVMRPNVNIDRGADNTPENLQKHINLKSELRKLVFASDDSFKKYRNQTKKYLLI